MNFRERWDWYVKASFWLALIGGPLGLLSYLGVQFYTRFLEPDPIEIKYVCQSINENNRANGYLYKSKKKAIDDLEKYERTEIVTVKISPSNMIELKPEEKVYVIRYVNDSSLARIKIVDEIDYNDTTYLKGWIPTLLLHDSICSQGRPGVKYKIDQKQIASNSKVIN